MNKYLTDRGWVDCGDDLWRAPPSPLGTYMYAEVNALIVQRAWDAADERAAWVAFAAADIGAAIMDARHSHHIGPELARHMADAVGLVADAMLDAYRARFGEDAK